MGSQSISLRLSSNMQSVVILSAVLACAAALPAAPGYAPQPTYDEPAVYAYQYGVADDYSGAQFGQNEKRDGYSTSGSYRVALPDGRTQVVSYHTADAYSGNVAEVSYEGVPHYGPAPAHPAAHPVHAVHAPVVAHAVYAPVVAHAVHAPVHAVHAVHAPVHAVHAVHAPIHAVHAVHAPVHAVAHTPVFHG